MGCVNSAESEENSAPSLSVNAASNISSLQSTLPSHIKKIRSKSNVLIPYEEEDPLNEKIYKIRKRWQMNKNNFLTMMRDLKFNEILQMSIEICLVDDPNVHYTNCNEVMDHLIKSDIKRTIFWQYWKMDKIISCHSVIRQHLQYLFEFQKWKIDEQIAYIINDDLPFLAPYNPALNSKQLIV